MIKINKIEIYDEFINDLINDISRNICLLIPNIEFLILTGSGGRGELSYIKDGDSLKIFSDLEYFIVLKSNKNISRYEKNEIRKILKVKYEESEFSTPFFHIDFSIVTSNQYFGNDTMLGIETINKSYLIYGDKIAYKTAYKTYNENNQSKNEIETINFKDINNIIIYRHYAIISNYIYKPKDWIDYSVNMYCVCRNSLDLLSIILYHNKIFATSYEEKVKQVYTIKCNLKNNKFEKIIEDEFIEFINYSYRYKMNPHKIHSVDDVEVMLNKYIKYSRMICEELRLDNECFNKTMNDMKSNIWKIYYCIYIKRDFRLYMKAIRTNYLDIYRKLDENLNKITCNYECDNEVKSIYGSLFPYSIK